MSPEQAKAIMSSIHEVEAWAGGLLSKCAQLKKLVEDTGAVSTAPTQQHPDRVTLLAKQRARMFRKRK
jgi:hypothetical protein